MRPSIKTIFLAPAFVFAAACSKDKPADPSLSTDLSLATQADSARLDSITAAERVKSATAAAPARQTTAPSTTRRSSSSSSSSGSSGSSSNTTVTAQPTVEIHKNTKRDAAIGAAAGAVLGGVVGHGGVKGAVIGGAAGAVLGGVIGNNVDVQKKKKP